MSRNSYFTGILHLNWTTSFFLRILTPWTMHPVNVIHLRVCLLIRLRSWLSSSRSTIEITCFGNIILCFQNISDSLIVNFKVAYSEISFHFMSKILERINFNRLLSFCDRWDITFEQSVWIRRDIPFHCRCGYNMQCIMETKLLSNNTSTLLNTLFK